MDQVLRKRPAPPERIRDLGTRATYRPPRRGAPATFMPISESCARSHNAPVRYFFSSWYSLRQPRHLPYSSPNSSIGSPHPRQSFTIDEKYRPGPLTFQELDRKFNPGFPSRYPLHTPTTLDMHAYSPVFNSLGGSGGRREGLTWPNMLRLKDHGLLRPSGRG